MPLSLGPSCPGFQLGSPRGGGLQGTVERQAVEVAGPGLRGPSLAIGCKQDNGSQDGPLAQNPRQQGPPCSCAGLRSPKAPAVAPHPASSRFCSVNPQPCQHPLPLRAPHPAPTQGSQTAGDKAKLSTEAASLGRQPSVVTCPDAEWGAGAGLPGELEAVLCQAGWLPEARGACRPAF